MDDDTKSRLAQVSLLQHDKKFLKDMFDVEAEHAPRLPVAFRLVFGEAAGQKGITDDFWDKPHRPLPMQQGQQRGDPAALNRRLRYAFDRFDESRWNAEQSHPACAPIRSCPIVGCTAFHHNQCCFATYERARRIECLPAQSISWEEHEIKHKTCTPEQMRAPFALASSSSRQHCYGPKTPVRQPSDQKTKSSDRSSGSGSATRVQQRKVLKAKNKKQLPPVPVFDMHSASVIALAARQRTTPAVPELVPDVDMHSAAEVLMGLRQTD